MCTSSSELVNLVDSSADCESSTTHLIDHRSQNCTNDIKVVEIITEVIETHY